MKTRKQKETNEKEIHLLEHSKLIFTADDLLVEK